MKKLQWNSFEKKIYIQSSIDKLYYLWATQAGITSWFLQNAVFKKENKQLRKPSENIQKGDTYVWHWHNWDGKGEGKITEANGVDFIAFTFENSMVSVHFEQKENVVVLTLKQYEIPEDDSSKLKIHCGCSNGWTFWLTNLKAYVEHGILLNETEMNLKNQDLAGWIFVNM